MTVKYLDARGLICPFPVLKARKVLLSMGKGEVLAVTVTDKNAPEDFRLFCAEAGHDLQSIQQNEEEAVVTVRAFSAPSSK
jgi:tRNA 2-thiouridine synthesizing protein A